MPKREGPPFGNKPQSRGPKSGWDKMRATAEDAPQTVGGETPTNAEGYAVIHETDKDGVEIPSRRVTTPLEAPTPIDVAAEAKTASTMLREHLMSTAEVLRAKGIEPNDLPEWKNAYAEYVKIQELVARYAKEPDVAARTQLKQEFSRSSTDYIGERTDAVLAAAGKRAETSSEPVPTLSREAVPLTGEKAVGTYLENNRALAKAIEELDELTEAQTAANRPLSTSEALAADFERIKKEVPANFSKAAAGIIEDAYGPKVPGGPQEPPTLEQWRDAHTKKGAETHTVPTLEQVRAKETWTQWALRRNKELDDKANAFNDKIGSWVGSLNKGWSKIPWQAKLALGAALMTGTILTGGVGPLGIAIATVSAGRRVMGGIATYGMVDGILQRSFDKKARLWNSPGGRFLISVTAGVLAGGALGYLLHHEAGVPAQSEEGKHARDFLSKHWPDARSGAGSIHIAPLDIPAEPPGIPFHHIDAVVAHKGMGGIKLFSGLQEQLKAAYGDGPRPPSVQHVLNLKPEELAKQYGFYKPDGTLDSARILDGSALGMDDHGNVVFTPKGGSSSVLSIADKYAGRFLDSHHGAGAHHAAGGHASTGAHGHETTKHLNETMSARAGTPGHYEYMSAQEGAARNEAWLKLQAQHAPKPSLMDRVGRVFGGSSQEHPSSPPVAPIEHPAPQSVAPPIEHHAPAVSPQETGAAQDAHGIDYHGPVRSAIDARIAGGGVTPDIVTELTNEAQHMSPDPSLASYIEPNTGELPGPAVFLGHDGGLTVYGASPSGDMYEAQRTLAKKFAMASQHAVKVLLPDGARGYQLFNPDGSITVEKPGLFSFGYKPPEPLVQSVYAFPR